MSTSSPPKLHNVLVLHELLQGLGKATAFFTDDGQVHDQTEFYEACCDLLGLAPATDAYVEVITITNGTAFIGEFVKSHKKDLVAQGWLAA
jgi:hypothetical protein